MTRPESDSGEQGFILITAIWLLVLAGAIVALLLLRATSASRESSFSRDLLLADSATESAVETVLADRMFLGVRSPWVLLPAESTVTIGDIPVRLRVTAESGRLDLNRADPERVDRLLRALGADGAARARFAQALAARRAEGHPIASFGEVRQMAETLDLRLNPTPCLEELVSFASGRADPLPGHMPTPLARALGQPAPQGSAPTGDGLLRIEAQPLKGRIRRTLRVIVRTTANGPLVASFERAALCPPWSD